MAPWSPVDSSWQFEPIPKVTDNLILCRVSECQAALSKSNAQVSAVQLPLASVSSSKHLAARSALKQSEDGDRVSGAVASLSPQEKLQICLTHPSAGVALIPKVALLFAAGAIAGAFGKTLTAPLDRLKLLLQTQGGLQKGTLLDAAQRGNLLKSFVEIGRQEGVLAYWKGNTAQLLRVVPYSAAQLCSYDIFKRVLADEKGDLTVSQRLLAGASAGMFSTLVTYPLDTLRLRLAVDPATRSIPQACQRLWAEAGARAFFRGIGPSLASIAPYMALELAAFDLLPRDMPSVARGFSAALFATSMCYPLDTVRRQIQVQAGSALAFRATIGNIARTEGVLGFYRGFLPSTVKNLPNKGVRLATFDAVKSVRSHGEVQLEQEAQRLRSTRAPAAEQVETPAVPYATVLSQRK